MREPVCFGVAGGVSPFNGVRGEPFNGVCGELATTLWVLVDVRRTGAVEIEPRFGDAVPKIADARFCFSCRPEIVLA